MKLSIIIPVYNEAKTIKEILLRVIKAKLPKDIKREIIVVDDGSTDETARILKEKFHNVRDIRLFSHKINRGKGAAIRTGIKGATGDILLIQDADLEYSPQYYPKLLEPIINGRSAVVYGSRLKDLRFKIFGRNRTPLPLHFLGNKFLTAITNFLYKGKITDMETGYKVFTRKAIEEIKITANRFDFEPEITAKILKKSPLKLSCGVTRRVKKLPGEMVLWLFLFCSNINLQTRDA